MRRTYTNYIGFGLMLIAINAKAQNTFPATGNVGIGTTNPGSALQVYNGTYSQNAISGWNSVFDIDRAGATIGGITSDGSSSIGLFTGSSDAWSNAKLAINSSGYVGIGTIAPQFPLQVNSAGSLGFANPAGFFQPGMLNGEGTSIFVGLSSATYQSAQLTYTYNSTTPSLSFASLALQGHAYNGVNVTGSGNVGIGTTAPGALLEVAGNVKLTVGSGASVTYQDGSVQTVAWNGVLSGGDYAESVDVIGDRTQYEPGDVLVIDPSSKGKFMKSTEAHSTAVMGIYSTRPGVVGRRQSTDKSHMKEEVPMAMVGVVPTKVSAESGAIKAGDLLVTSSKPGYAMKGKDRSQMMGAIIGKALEPLDAGTGVIEVAVSIQ